MNSANLDILKFPVYELYARLYGGCRSDPRQDPYHVRPKDRPWWPMRYFVDDWILGAWVYRVRERDERCEVGLFLAEDHYKYQKDSGLKGSLIFLLTQTYHLLGMMEVHFVGPRPNPGERMNRDRLIGRQLGRLDRVEADGFDPTSKEARNRVERILDTGFEPDIPPSIRRFAGDLGVKFANERFITDAEGRELYARMTGFSAEVIDGFQSRGIDLTRACFAVQRDVWSFEHVEYLLGVARDPARMFDGKANPLRRVEHQRDLLAFRVALMEERLRIWLREFTEPRDQAKRIRAEWDASDPTRVWYTADRPVTVAVAGNKSMRIEADRRVSIKLIPRNAVGYRAFQKTDLESTGDFSLIAVTRDFGWSGVTPPNPDATGVGVIELFDTLEDYDREVQIRLAQAESTRGELSERHD